MKETKRMISLFEKLYAGNPWIDVNISETLDQITAEQAAGRISRKSNSIWEIVNHLINWRMNVLKRIQGKVIKTPASNYIEPVTDHSDQALVKTKKKLSDSQKQWISCLADFKAENFSKIYPGNDLTFYEHIHGIIQHDAYHLGQIRIIMKYVL